MFNDDTKMCICTKTMVFDGVQMMVCFVILGSDGR